MKNRTFQPDESKAVGGLTLLYSIRMLGLFMVLPILAIYSEHLRYATPTMVGIALGIYGLTQAILQIPFGILSDRIGRKPVIFFGLCLLLVGSIVAAQSTTMYGVIIGRCLQGSGAISGVIMALVADRTREEVRTQAMAVIGICIGISIGLSMVIGPVIAHYFGLDGVFLATALLAMVGMLILWVLVPAAPVRTHKDVGMDFHQLTGILRRVDLLRLDYAIFSLHCIFTALFVALPIKISALGFTAEGAGWIYLPLMATSFIAMTPLVVIAEKRRKMKPVFIGNIVLLAATLAAMYLMPAKSWWLLGLLWLFFFAFNLMEAVLPSMISKIAPAGGKGTALGVYSTSQFLGTTVGGALGGLVASHFGTDVVFLFVAVVALLWLLSAWSMRPPQHLSSEIESTTHQTLSSQTLQSRLLKVPGVVDAMVVDSEGLAYLKVDKLALDRDQLNELLNKPAPKAEGATS
ncbi:MFS transporter [Carnimonas nigrificans]|uniref:MFS transporter n=1 Tax=Carnimonas nigrificans TaxID=64323 RepID=UPI0004725B95|nr:MFS transporter [Carnimonas nigrificans]